MSIAKKIRLACLIDADNVGSPDAIASILQQLQTWHDFICTRAYGNWFDPSLKAWQGFLAAHGGEPVHSLPTNASGKNATDIRLVIDAMDLLRNDTIEGFCIVSGDSDFAPLVRRLKQNNKVLIGVGRENTPKSLKDAYHTFIAMPSSGKTAAAAPTTTPQLNTAQQHSEPAAKTVLQLVSTSPPSSASTKTSTSKKARATAKTTQSGQNAKASPVQEVLPYAKELLVIVKAAYQLAAQGEEWVTLSHIESHLKTQCMKIINQGFSCKLFGCNGLVKLFDSTGLFEWEALKNSKVKTKDKKLRLRKVA